MYLCICGGIVDAMPLSAGTDLPAVTQARFFAGGYEVEDDASNSLTVI